MQPLVECIPNFSEGRRTEVIQAVIAPLVAQRDIRLLDVDPNADHNRTVVTFVGPPAAVADAAFALTASAVQALNMEEHRGEHPRMGAMDVVPFVPISGVTMDDCVRLAQEVGERIANE